MNISFHLVSLNLMKMYQLNLRNQLNHQIYQTCISYIDSISKTSSTGYIRLSFLHTVCKMLLICYLDNLHIRCHHDFLSFSRCYCNFPMWFMSDLSELFYGSETCVQSSPALGLCYQAVQKLLQKL